MKILQRYRILFYALGIVVLLGSWEVFTLKYFSRDAKGFARQLEMRNQHEDRELDLSRSVQQSLSRSLQELYPDNPDAIYLQGLQQAYASDEFLVGCHYYLKAANLGATHNEELLIAVINCLERQQKDPGEIQLAVTRWRRNYPHSSNFPLQLRFAGFAGVSDPARVAELALQSSRTLKVLGCNPVKDSGGNLVLDVYLRVSGPEIDVAAVRKRLVEAGFQLRPPPSADEPTDSDSSL